VVTRYRINLEQAKYAAYSGQADQRSGLKPIRIPGRWGSPSERSDAGLFHDAEVIGIRQSFFLSSGEWGAGRGGGI